MMYRSSSCTPAALPIKIMEAYQTRVIEEKKELDDKISRLQPFINGERFMSLSVEEQHRMLRQFVLMEKYSAVLGERIAAFR